MSYQSIVLRFTAYIPKKTQTDDMRLLFLLQYCKPDVRENIERFTFKDPTDGYRLAWQTLFERYGQPHVIAQCCEQHLKKAPDVKQHDPESLTKLPVLMDKCLTSMQGIGCVSSVDSMKVMLAVLKKLPVSLQEKWVEKSSQSEWQTGRRATFISLATFVAEESTNANSIFGKALFPAVERRLPKVRGKVSSHNVVFAMSESENAAAAANSKVGEETNICPCCSACHHLIKRKVFAELTSREKRTLVHLIRDCKVRTGCSVEGCGQRMSHLDLLHDSKPSPIGGRVKESSRNGNGDCSTTETTMASEVSVSQSQAVILKVVDIDPQGSNGPSKRSVNSQGVEWGALNGQGVNEKLLGSTGDVKPPIQKLLFIGQGMQTAFFKKSNRINKANQISATVV